MQYSDNMLKLMVIEEEMAKLETAIRKNNPSVLRNCGAYHATLTRRLRPQDVYSLLKAQDIKCPLCGLSFENVRWDIDHDYEAERKHGVKLVRGLLCHSCNIWLGKWEGVITRAYGYLAGSGRKLLDE